MKNNRTIFYSILFLSFFLTSVSAQQRSNSVSPLFNSNISGNALLSQNQSYSTKSLNVTSALTGNVFKDGADRLTALQYTDGSWGWPLNAPPTYANILGPITMGLAESYYYTSDATHLAALNAAGAYLLTKTNNFSPSDGYLAAKLDQIFGGNTYKTFVINNFYGPLAAGTYDRNGLGTLYNTAGYVQLIRTSRSGTQANLAAWDIGMGLVGAAMCGASTTEWIDGTEAEINELDGNGDYDVIGLAGALYGLAFVGQEFDPTAGQHAAASNLMDLANILASYQINHGGFAWNSNYVIPNDGDEAVQETAYAILALNQVNRNAFLSNIIGAGNYLLSIQLATGGWEEYTGAGENNEITGEALWGISMSGPVENFTQKTFHLTIQNAIDLANPADVINVAAGAYTESLSINKSLTLNGAKTGIAYSGRTFGNGNESTLTGDISITAANVTVNGFSLTNPAGTRCIYVASTGNHTDIIDNIFNDVGNGTSNLNVYPIYLSDGADNVNIIGNSLSNIYANGKTDAAIFLGDSIGPDSFDNITIQDNLIFDVYSTGLIRYWGAYGILANHSSTNLHILNNNIHNVEGEWAHGIGLEGNSLNAVVTGNQLSYLIDHKTPTDAYAIFFETNSSYNTVDVSNNSFDNVLGGVGIHPDMFPLTSSVTAQNNWWGTASGPTHASNPGGTGAIASDSVNFDPWVGKEESKTITQTNTNYNYSTSGVTLNFSTLPTGGGTVKIKRYNEQPSGYPAPPAGATAVGLWLDISSPDINNYEFNVTVTVDVSDIPDFGSSTTVMYYNSSTDAWIVLTGTYNAGAKTFTFTTNHFTPYAFVNTPGTAYDIYLAQTPGSASTSQTIYPVQDLTTYPGGEDWDWSNQTFDVYIIPGSGATFYGSKITVAWNKDKIDLQSVTEGNIWNQVTNYNFFTNPSSSLDTASSIEINATIQNAPPANVTGDGSVYIAKLTFKINKPGYSQIDITSADIRDDQNQGVYFTIHNAQSKMYLGDVYNTDGTDATKGDGLVNFDDLSPFSAAYWSTTNGTYNAGTWEPVSPATSTLYKRKYDVGPTGAPGYVYTQPIPDNKIDFEDLMIFSISYGLSQGFVFPKILPIPNEPAIISLGKPIISGSETLVPVMLSGTVSDIRGMKLRMNGSFGKLLGVNKGSVLDGYSTPVMLLSNTRNQQVMLDFSVVGLKAQGVSKEGEIAVLRFSGNANLNISSAEIRNSANDPMLVKTSIEENSTTLPKAFIISQNYPNPFNPTTVIEYQLPKQSQVELQIYNMLGQLVRTLVNKVQEAGSYKVNLDASQLASGVYFYRIKANDFVAIKKMLLMK